MDEPAFQMFMGMRVSSSANVPEWQPKEKLSAKVQVTDRFRQEFNAWLEEFFGRVRVTYIMQLPMGGQAIVGHKNTVRLIEQEARKRGE